MADPIVQTIKIEVDGADQAASEIQKVGQATEEVQKTAESSAGGTQALGNSLDEVSQKSSISGRELRSLSKIAKEFGADSVVVGLSLVRMAAVLGPLGAAMFALGAAFSAVKGQMKAAEASASSLASTFETLAEKSAAANLKDEAAFWGMDEAAMKKWNDQAARVIDQYKNIAAGRAKAIGAEVSPEARQRGLLEILRRAGVEFDDVNAGAEKLNENGNRALMVFAQLADNMSPIGRSQLFKDMKSFGFTDEQISSVKKGSAALQKMQEEAARFKASPEGKALEEFERSFKESQEMVADGVQWLKIKFTQAVLGLKDFRKEMTTKPGAAQALINDLVSTPVANAWRWIVDTFNTAVASVISTASSVAASVVAFVLQAPGNAWRWIVDTFNMAVAAVTSTASSVAASVVAFVLQAPGNAWRWIVDTFNMAVAAVASLASSAAASVLAFFTTAPGVAWRWIVDTFNMAVDAVASLASSVAASVLDFFTTAPGAAWQWVVDTFTAAVDAVITKANECKNFITSWVTTAVPGAWEWLKSAFFSVVDALLAKAQSSGLFGGGGGATARAAAPGAAAGGLLGGRGTGTSDSNLAWVSRGEYIIPARAVAQPGVLAFLEALRRSGGKLRGVLDGMGRFATGGLIPAYAGGGTVSGGGDFDVVITSLQNSVHYLSQFEFFAGVVTPLQHIVDVLERFRFNVLEAAGIGWKEWTWAGQANASGGLLGGRGTGTSDSNLAWVSRGEHIMPASAVRQPGVLAFLEALRRSGGNLRDVLDGMGAYALGGMVRAPLAIPAFAGGGGMSNVTIQFPGLPDITGLRASSNVVDELRKAAAMAQVRSGGRKPSRYS